MPEKAWQITTKDSEMVLKQIVRTPIRVQAIKSAVYTHEQLVTKREKPQRIYLLWAKPVTVKTNLDPITVREPKVVDPNALQNKDIQNIAAKTLTYPAKTPTDQQFLDHLESPCWVMGCDGINCRDEWISPQTSCPYYGKPTSS